MRLPRFRKRHDPTDRERSPAAEERSSADARQDEIDRLAAAAAELSVSLGQAPADEARLAAVERLTELRAEGRVSEDDFVRERRRLMGEG